jgi:hypothetical protein
MTFEAAASNADVAWITVAGTLGGVVVTAAFGVLTAFLTQQWQYRRSEQQHRFEVERELRTARRDCYVRYIVSAQNVFDRSYDFYLKNRAAPVQVAEFALQPPQVVNDALARNETCRVEALLLAGDEVRAALKEYDDRLRGFWKAAGSGSESEESEIGQAEATAYHQLIASMQADVSAL